MSILFQEFAILLNLCPICPDIQYKILMLIIGINGTPSSNEIKKEIKKQIQNVNIYSNDYICVNDFKTLWRTKIYLNCTIFDNLNATCSYELIIAYLTTGYYEMERQYYISKYNNKLINDKNIKLYKLFYNLDKYHYAYIGTLESCIIKKAIYDKNILFKQP